MFNGIIEVVGGIRRIDFFDGGAKLVIDAGRFGKILKPGNSVAVDGICLTAVKKKGTQVEIDVSAETWQKTNLREKKKGDRVNLELPITGETFISGHFVQGHVEGLARITGWVRKGQDIRLCLRLPADVVPFCVSKGSIAINGVSLTIASLRGRSIEIALIPYTLEHTNLGDLQPGDVANIESDVIGRYVVSTLKKAYHKVIRR